jgi:hypothetical protein
VSFEICFLKALVQRKSETAGNNESIVFVLATLDNGSRQLQFAIVHEP